MKRYYVSFRRYGIVATALPVLFILNGILFINDAPESDGILGFVNEYSYIMWFLIGILSLVHVYKIYTKKVFFEINESNMIYKFGGKGIFYEFSDADSYIAKQSGSSRTLIYISKNTNKKVKVRLSTFDINFTEFLTLLTKYSHKDVYTQEYGLEPVLFNRSLEK